MEIRSAEQLVHIVLVTLDPADTAVIFYANEYRTTISISQSHKILGQMSGLHSGTLELHELGFARLDHP